MTLGSAGSLSPGSIRSHGALGQVASLPVGPCRVPRLLHAFRHSCRGIGVSLRDPRSGRTPPGGGEERERIATLSAALSAASSAAPSAALSAALSAAPSAALRAAARIRLSRLRRLRDREDEHDRTAAPHRVEAGRRPRVQHAGSRQRAAPGRAWRAGRCVSLQRQPCGQSAVWLREVHGAPCLVVECGAAIRAARPRVGRGVEWLHSWRATVQDRCAVRAEGAERRPRARERNSRKRQALLCTAARAQSQTSRLQKVRRESCEHARCTESIAVASFNVCKVSNNY